MTTHKDKPMPVDAEPTADGNLVVEETDSGLRSRPVEPLLDKPPFYVSHFATCPAAADFRKR